MEMFIEDCWRMDATMIANGSDLRELPDDPQTITRSYTLEMHEGHEQ